MTIEELCNLSLEELDAMSMTQLEEFFKPYWPVTRPVRKATVEQAPTTKGFTSVAGRKKRSTNPDQIKFESTLTPEKRAFMESLGLKI